MNNCCTCDFDLEVAYKHPSYLIVNYKNENGDTVYGRLLVRNNGVDKKLVIPKDKQVKKLMPLIFTDKTGRKFIGIDTKRNKFLATYGYDTLPSWFLLGYEQNGERFPFVFSNWGDNLTNFNFRLLNPINRQSDTFESQDFAIKIKTLNEIPLISYIEPEDDYVIIKRGRFLKKIKFHNFNYYFKGYTAEGF